MTGFIDVTVAPWVGFLAGWSLRWGVVLAGLAAWLRLRPPRRAATRHALCLGALAAGLLLPASPRWGRGLVPTPARPDPTATPAPSEVPPPSPATVDATTTASTAGPPRTPAPAPIEPTPPTEPTAPGPGAARLALLAVGLSWAAITSLVAARLVAGLVALGRLRRRSAPVGDSSRRLLTACRAELGLSRRVGLASDPSIGSPVTLGGSRPLVLVPPGWDAWPEPDRRVCLLHELSHLARGDDWIKLAQEVVRVPLAFHPMVLWLLARLDFERELLCDEAVVARGVDPLAYARVLLGLANRPGRIRPGLDGGPCGLPFLDRGTVAARIHRLLEDDMAQDIRNPSARKTLGLAALAVAAALGLGGIRVRAVEPDPSPEMAGPARVVEGRPPLSGVVRDPDGTPLADADVVVVSKTAKTAGCQVLRTGPDGRFSCPVPPGGVELHLYARKEGYAALAQYSWLPAEKDSEPIDLGLGRPEPWTATLVDGDGRPIAGADVRIDTLATPPVTTQLSGGRRTVMVCYEHVRAEEVRGTPLESAYLTRSGSDGRVSFDAVRPGYSLKFTAKAPGRGSLRGDGRRNEGLPDGVDPGFVPRPSVADGRIWLVPSARIAGRVVTRLPGVGVAGLRVMLQSSHDPHDQRPKQQGGEATTDAGGRFAFDDLDEGAVNVFLSDQPADGPWTSRAAGDLPLKNGETAAAEIELIEGVRVEGRVVAADDGTPVKGAGVGHHGPGRPSSGAAILSALTDREGIYRFRVPSGDSRFYICGGSEGFMRADGEGATQSVRIEEGATRVTAPPIRLKRAVSLHGRVVDAQGRPVPRATILGVCTGGFCRLEGSTPAGVADERGEFRLAGQNHTAAPGEKATVQVRLGDGRDFEVPVVPAADGSVTVVLPVSLETPKPPIEAKVAPDELAGVVVDAGGRPIEDVGVNPSVPLGE